MSQDDDATIERVARAICEATSGPFEMLDDVGRDALRCEARAAITAYLSAMPQRDELRIGDMMIRHAPNGIWIGRMGGEGGEFGTEHVERVIARFYRENF